jgi:predicted SnoaL-like aldol condensation-catalyzing enzyme
MKMILMAFCLSVGFWVSPATANETNKLVVQQFYETAFNGHDPASAMSKYVGSRYIQHNPMAGDGKQPFIDFFTEFYKKHPKARVVIKRLISEGDLVVVHTHSRLDESDRGNAVVDIFRLEKGKIVEHWDVMQPVPEKSANDNGMF